MFVTFFNILSYMFIRNEIVLEKSEFSKYS